MELICYLLKVWLTEVQIADIHASRKERVIKHYLSYFSTKTYAIDAQKNPLWDNTFYTDA